MQELEFGVVTVVNGIPRGHKSERSFCRCWYGKGVKLAIRQGRGVLGVAYILEPFLVLPLVIVRHSCGLYQYPSYSNVYILNHIVSTRTLLADAHLGTVFGNDLTHDGPGPVRRAEDSKPHTRAGLIAYGQLLGRGAAAQV